jgi:hypothetical protein
VRGLTTTDSRDVLKKFIKHQHKKTPQKTSRGFPPKVPFDHFLGACDRRREQHCHMRAPSHVPFTLSTSPEHERHPAPESPEPRGIPLLSPLQPQSNSDKSAVLITAAMHKQGEEGRVFNLSSQREPT